MTDRSRKSTWLSAIAEAAELQGFKLPTFDAYGMGALRSAKTGKGRFITLKRRMAPTDQAGIEGVEWALWLEEEDLPVPIAAFRDPLHPAPENVTATLSLLKGWLVEEWTPDEAKTAVGKHPRSQAVPTPPPPTNDKQEYWLSEDRGFGIVVAKDRWSLHSRGKCLSSWRAKSNSAAGDYLDLASLHRLCSWLAAQWQVIAYGGDYRPLPLRGYPVAASKAYENAQLAQAIEKDQEVPAWWSRHAIRAADAELPNVFLERQADVIVVSWDASPTPSRFYQLPSGEEAFRVAFAVPVLRKLVKDRLKSGQHSFADREEFAAILSSNASVGYAAITRYNPSVSDEWLASHGFSDKDAQEFAVSGTSRHPIVGLLRSSQDTLLTPEDYDTLLSQLKPSEAHSFTKLREVAKGLNFAIDTREPWESGYQLARLVRERLGFTPSAYIDIEDVLRQMVVETQDAKLSDATILGLCVGTPGYSPLVILNSSCEDVIGVSGRRVTLAHEFCHLLFDRTGLRSLARFEGGGADSDRLIEMRANAFAVELLVPMATLVGDNGVVVDDARIAEIAVERKVSFHALERHANNLRNRLSGP